MFVCSMICMSDILVQQSLDVSAQTLTFNISTLEQRNGQMSLGVDIYTFGSQTGYETVDVRGYGTGYLKLGMKPGMITYISYLPQNICQMFVINLWARQTDATKP